MLELFEYVDPSELAMLDALDGCAGWIAALLLLAIGFLSVRPAHATAGYLVAGAGGLQLLSWCCISWQNPAWVWMDMGEAVEAVGGLSSAIAILCRIGTVALVIAGAVVLSKALKERSASGPVSSEAGA